MGAELSSAFPHLQYPVFLGAHLHWLSVVRIFALGALGNIYILAPKVSMTKSWSPPKFTSEPLTVLIGLAHRTVREGYG